MKILHTSDWHLGKKLEGISRLEEQKLFLIDFVKTVKENDIDLVIIAGDIYDSSNPKAAAEKLFYDVLKEISEEGRRTTLIVAGNHDSPDRLTAPQKICEDLGIIIMGTPNSIVETGAYGKNIVYESDKGYFKISINGEEATIISVPYPSEKTLNEAIYNDLSEEEEDIISYNDKICKLFSSLESHFEDDTINICVSHLFTLGSAQTETGSSLGGSLIVKGESLPVKAQYIALGHIHKMQVVSGTNGAARYCGSPLQYNKKEINYKKGCYIVELHKKTKPIINEIYFKTYKPIQVWKCKCIEEAIETCRQKTNENSYVYIEIETDKFIGEDDIKAMKSLKGDIVQISPVVTNEKPSDFDITGEISERSFEELFREFYIKNNNMEPTEELAKTILNIFKEIE